jgi:hypothetical protein
MPIRPMAATKTIKKVVVSNVIGRPRGADLERSGNEYALAGLRWIGPFENARFDRGPAAIGT